MISLGRQLGLRTQGTELVPVRMLSVPHFARMPLRILGCYVFGWILPGAWAGALGEALVNAVPEGWYFCFPDLKPGFVSGLALAILLPLLRPPRLSRIQFVTYGLATPLLIPSVACS